MEVEDQAVVKVRLDVDVWVEAVLSRVRRGRGAGPCVDRHTEREREREREREINSQTDRKRHRKRNRKRNRKTDRARQGTGNE